MTHPLRVPPVGSVVTVRGGRGAMVLKPWRAKVVATSERSAAVLPLERGRGWATEPVIVRLSILEAV